MTTKILSTLFAQKSWANRELFEVLTPIADAPEHAEPVHTAIRLLNHIYVVDRIFRAHLIGEPHEYTATNTTQTPPLDELRFAVADTDQWLENYVSTISNADLAQSLAFEFTDGDHGSMSREEMLFHLITHGAYHRGNVGQILRGLSVAPPRDLLTRFLHTSEPARRNKQ